MREFSALSDRFKDAQEWLNYRVALVCTIMANMWRSPKSRPFTIADFMPGRRNEPQTPKQMLATMEILKAAHGDRITKEEHGHRRR